MRYTQFVVLLLTSGLQDLEHDWQTGENAGTTQGDTISKFASISYKQNFVQPLLNLHPSQSANIIPGFFVVVRGQYLP